MSLDPRILHAMANAGASTEVILAACDAQAQIDAERREKAREGAKLRKRKERDKKRHGVSQRDKCDPPPNEYISNPPPVSPSPNGDSPQFSEKIVLEWNSHAAKAGARKAQVLRANRLAKLKLRVKEFGEETLLEGIRRLATSDWHTGKSGDWKAGLGWYLNSAENVNKALEFELPETERKSKVQTPEEWLEFCEQQVRKARRIGDRSGIEHWEAAERKARAKLPRLKVVQ